MNPQAMVGGLFIALTLGALAQAADADDVAGGHALALQFCAACHTVAPDQREPPKLQPPAPAFAVIANGPGVQADEVYEFLRANHRSGKTPPEMPALVLTDAQARAATAYLISLRNAP